MEFISYLPEATDSFVFPTELPLFDSSKNEKSGIYLYRYSSRHILTTFLTKLLDRIFRFRHRDEPFVDRIKIAKSLYSEAKVQ